MCYYYIRYIRYAYSIGHSILRDVIRYFLLDGSDGTFTLGDNIPGVNYAWNPSKDPEEDVDAELRSEAAFE